MARAKGQGNIYKRGETYYLRFTVNGKKKTVSLQTKNKTEAEKKAKELLAPSEANNEAEAAEFIAKAKGLITSDRIALDDGWKLYFKSKRRLDSGELTLKSYEQYWNKFIKYVKKKHGKQIEFLDELTSKVAEEFMDSLDLAPNTYNKYKNFLKLYFNTVGNKCGVHHNPFREITTQRQKKESWRELTESETQKLKDLPRSEDWAILNIGIYTGMRMKDAAMLKWVDVNLVNEKIIFTPSKTAKSEKVVHLPILSKLKEVLLWAQGRKLSGQYVLPGMAEKYIRGRDYLSRYIRSIFDAQEITEGKIGFHSLRHTFVSECAKSGVPLSIVQSIVGHGSPAMTRHYTHIDVESARKWLEPDTESSSQPDIDKVFALAESMNKSNWQEVKKEILALKNTVTLDSK